MKRGQNKDKQPFCAQSLRLTSRTIFSFLLFQIMPYFVMHVLNYPGVPGVFCACVLCASLRSVCMHIYCVDDPSCLLCHYMWHRFAGFFNCSSLSSLLNSGTALMWSDLVSLKFHYMTEGQKTVVIKFISKYLDIL